MLPSVSQCGPHPSPPPLAPNIPQKIVDCYGKTLDKEWFRTGGPKRVGSATVYIDRKRECYRIKPGNDSTICSYVKWGKTEEQQLSQWIKVLKKIVEYNGKGYLLMVCGQGESRQLRVCRARPCVPQR